MFVVNARHSTLKVDTPLGESLFTFSASLTYAHHYLMKLIK